MGIAMFYQLQHSGLDETLRMLLGRALQQNWRVMIRATNTELLRRLDDRLWTDPADGFLPHGVEGGAHDADQPILLGTGLILNAAQGLFLVGGAETTPTEAADLERVWVLFDGNDADNLGQARGLWLKLTGAGLAAQYWSEDGGRWEKKAEKLAKSDA